MPAGSYIDLAAGPANACAVKSDGSLACWGDASSVTTSMPSSGAYTRIWVGDTFACARKDDGTLACWGTNTQNQLADAPTGQVDAALTEFDTGCAIRADTTLVCWGNNGFGAATPPGGTFDQIAGGALHACALGTNGLAACWGDNTYGQNGAAPQITSSAPPPAVVGTPYSHAYTTTGNPAVATYRVSSGSLPPGLTLNVFTGALSGTPTVVGAYNGTVAASDEFFADATQPFTIQVASAPSGGGGSGGGGGGGAGGAGPPAPVAGQSVAAQVVNGTVEVTCPGQGTQPLSGVASVKLGCTVDATDGTVAITSASDTHGGTQTANFYDGAFTLGQSTGTSPGKLTAAAKKKKGKKKKVLYTDLTLTGPAPTGCGKKKGKLAAARRGRRLWGSGHGHFRTRARHAAATVRGTTWLTEERCAGTYVQVNRGIVSVRDLTRRLTVTVKAGHHYLAPAKKPKKKH